MFSPRFSPDGTGRRKTCLYYCSKWTFTGGIVEAVPMSPSQWLVRAVIGLKNGPVATRKRPPSCLSGSGQSQNGRSCVQLRVLQFSICFSILHQPKSKFYTVILKLYTKIVSQSFYSIFWFVSGSRSLIPTTVTFLYQKYIKNTKIMWKWRGLSSKSRVMQKITNCN